MSIDAAGIGQAVTSLKDIVGMFFPDKTEAEKAQIAATVAIIKGQQDANTAEAAQPGIHFRDGAGWVCVVSFGLSALKAPIEWGTALAGHPVVLPAADSTLTYSMLIGLLGLGGMHMNEQVQANK